MNSNVKERESERERMVEIIADTCDSADAVSFNDRETAQNEILFDHLCILCAW